MRRRLKLALSCLAVTSVTAAGCAPSCPDLVTPSSDDPESSRQWWLPALGVPAAWSVQRGSPEVVLAVIDNGFDLEHPDLSGQLWVNEGEIGDNGLDDDGNGYVDDRRGWDFLDDDGDPSLEPSDSLESALLGHGTAAAGVVAARADNDLGIAGACPGCRLMLLRARDFREAHNVMPRLAAAIRYAVANGAWVISLSDGVSEATLERSVAEEGEAAIDEALDAGVLLVASAGNDGADHVRWPARLDQVVAVAAVDDRLEPTSWTSYGAEVDLAAPGVCVYTTAPGGEYRSFEGTSASAPIVAGLVALLRSEHPDWTPTQLIDRLQESARPPSLVNRPEVEGLLGAGVVDFGAALAE